LTSSPELLNIHNAFHQGQYQNVIDFDISSLSAENVTPARVLQLRAQIAAGQAEQVVASAQKENDAPDFAAVKAFAMHVIGDTAEGWQEMEELLQSAPGNVTVQVLGGTLLQAAGKSEEALAVLSKHQGSLEA
jgi:coatomer protein complex subunit epsilon